jgi:hypothetical protein
MRLRVLYADLITCKCDASDYGASPCRGVLRVSVEHPEPGKFVHFSGWDHYGVMVDGERTLVGVWKTDDETDPYFGQGMVWTFGPGRAQARTPYMPNAELPEFKVTRRGQWVADDVARSVGLL